MDTRFLELDGRDFMAEYEFYMILHQEVKTLKERLMIPDEIPRPIPDMKEVEIEFVRSTLKCLHERNEEILILRRKMAKAEFKKHHISEGGKMNDDEYIAYSMKNNNLSKTVNVEFDNYNFKLTFLIYKAQKLGFTIDIGKELKFNEIEENNTFDSQFLDTKGSEKLVFLKETGIIDFLKERNPGISKNKLAKLLSAITGEKHLQPGLNAMEGSQKYSDRKSPYFSTKSAPRVKEQLNQWGFLVKEEST